MNVDKMTLLSTFALFTELLTNVFAFGLSVLKYQVAPSPKMRRFLPKFHFRETDGVPLDVIIELLYRDIKAMKCLVQTFRSGVDFSVSSVCFVQFARLLEPGVELIQIQPKLKVFRFFCPQVSGTTADSLLVVYSALLIAVRIAS